MDQHEIALQMRSALLGSLTAVSSELTSADIACAEQTQEMVNNAIDFNKPLVAIMEMMVLAGTLNGSENAAVRQQASLLVSKLRRTAGYGV